MEKKINRDVFLRKKKEPDKVLHRLTLKGERGEKRKKRRFKIRSKRGNITTDIRELQKFLRNYYEQLYTSK